MPFPLILSEIPAALPVAEVSPHLAEQRGPSDASPDDRSKQRPETVTGALCSSPDSPSNGCAIPSASLLLTSAPQRSGQLSQPPSPSFSVVGLALSPSESTAGEPQSTAELLDLAAGAEPTLQEAVEPENVRTPLGQPGFLGQTTSTPIAPPASTAWQDRSFPPSQPLQADPASEGPGSAEANPPLFLRADRQEFSPADQVISAYGDVLIQFGDAQLSSNRLWVNLQNRFVRAEEDVLFTRNQQIIAGSSALYNLIQGAGSIFDAQGELALDETGQDFSTDFRILGSSSQVLGPAPRAPAEQGSVSAVTSPGGISFGTDARNLEGAESNDINRLRFEASRIDFDASGWYAEDVRLTNDPFSPPEIEFRGDTARLTPLNPEEDELVITNARVVFDQGFSLPLLRSRIILRRGQVDPSDLNPIPTNVGIDGRDRGGLYVERAVPLNIGGPWQLTFVPQFYLQRWLTESTTNIADPANFGLVANLSGALGPRTSVSATANLSGLDLANFNNRLRASVRGQQLIGDHLLTLEYSYRDRLFNGSLGFQDVQSSLGAVLLSPVVRLGDTQIDLTYQLAAQYVTAATDRPELLRFGSSNNLTSLFRFQGSVALSRSFLLWQGTGLPPTQTAGLRYSPRPVVPFLQLVTGVRGIATYYSSNDLQETVTASFRLEGQLGQFSRPFLDYTRFNIGYAKAFVGGATSPFLFDRNVDQNVLSGGILQQIYGPFLAGFQTSFNLDTGRFIETDLVFEYSRRAYGLVLRYNPAQASGFIGFRLSDFDWVGRTDDFDAPRPQE